MDNLEVPEYFICPISLQIMKDPVTATTGITYDREWIERWLFNLKNETCPVTKQSLATTSELTPNHTLRRLIQQWCIQNEPNGFHRIPTPKHQLDTSHVIKLIKNLELPNVRLKTLKELHIIALQKERNMKYMLEANVVKAMVLFTIRCFLKAETDGLEEALSILCLVWSPSEEAKELIIENGQIVDSLVWVLGFETENKLPIKTNAVLLLKHVIETAKAYQVERLKPDFFRCVIGVLRENTSEQGINAALKILLEASSCSRNRVKMVKEGAISQLIELEWIGPERRRTELIFEILFRLCTCADGRAQILDHPAAIALISNKILRVSPLIDDRAISILSIMVKYLGHRNEILHEMLTVGALSRLCMVLHVECPISLKEKARAIVRGYSSVWRKFPCVSTCSHLARYIR